jgi:hypothetical protein
MVIIITSLFLFILFRSFETGFHCGLLQPQPPNELGL